MAAKCWDRRNRNKYIRQDLNWCIRNPYGFRIVENHNAVILGVKLAQEMGLLQEYGLYPSNPDWITS